MLRNSKLLTLFLTMIAVMVGFGIVIPIMPFYVEHFGAGGLELGMMMAVFSLAQFISAPYWGNLSDRHGRKRILMIGVIGNFLSLLFMGLSANYLMLFLSRAVGGILSSATLPTAMAYISDSTTEEERGGGMGIVGAAMGVGMVIGPGIGGLVSEDNLSLPFFIAAALSFLCFLMVVFVLPESLPPEKRTTQTARMRLVDPALLWKALRGPMGFLLFLAFLVNFALANFEGIFGLYAGERFDYGPQQVGSIMMVIGLVSALVQFLLTGPATRWLGEPRVIQLSLISSAVGFVLMVLVSQDALILLTVAFFVFSNAMLRPAIMSLASKISTEGQGVTMGLNNSFQSLGRMVGPLWAGATFDVNVNYPYLSAAVLCLITFVFALWSMQPARIRLASQRQTATAVFKAGED